MTQQGRTTPSNELNELMDEYSYLRTYVRNHNNETNEYPIVVNEENVDDNYARYPNLVYQITDNVFVHIYGDVGHDITYYTIEPDVDNIRLYEKAKEKIHKISESYSPPESNDRDAKKDYINLLLDKATARDKSTGLRNTVKNYFKNPLNVTDDEYQNLKYLMYRDIAGLGEIEPVMQDTNNEDIHLIGHDEIHVDHGTFSLIETDLGFASSERYDRYLRNLGERMNTPISDSNPIIDSTLPDGSRVNIVYSDDVSIQGSTVTIRQGQEVPLSIFQITKWGTLSPKMAAYLWLCLENERTVFVVGETASGKTTTLNAIMSFIPRDSKIYTAEDTAEVIPPHNTWQQLITRETPDEASTDVEMTDLVETALRARPDYIIVGEVRGEEAKQAFNAAQTGHPVMLTFHASDITSTIQRMNNDPMNVPKTDMVNADVMLFQNRVKREDDDEILRRVTEVNEVVSYDGERDSIVNKQMFQWDSATDEHEFTGMNNSHVLENKVAELLGYKDETKIYDELNRREKIIQRLIDADVVGYNEVNNTIQTIQNDGVEALDNIETTDLIKNR